MLTKNQLEYFAENTVFWNKLSVEEQEEIERCAFLSSYKKGEKIYGSSKECLGLVLIETGQLRAFIDSPDGKEISLYRLLQYDTCIMSASCMMKNISFEINIEAEKDTEVIVLPVKCYNVLNNSNFAVKNFSLDLISTRFSEVMWVFEQYVFGSAAKRLACFLLEQSNIERSDSLNMTHEFIANDIGTAREVITRLLKHFANDGIVSSTRGTIKIEKRSELQKLCN